MTGERRGWGPGGTAQQLRAYCSPRGHELDSQHPCQAAPGNAKPSSDLWGTMHMVYTHTHAHSHVHTLLKGERANSYKLSSDLLKHTHTYTE